MIQSYPWYIADWRESETRLSLSLAERGLYRELLDYCYLDGSLPANPSVLCRLAACSQRDFDRAWPKVYGLFQAEVDRLTHPKVNEVRRKLEAYHEQKRHAGSTSGRSRRERTLNARSTDAERTLNARSTDAEPTPSPSPTPSPAPSITGEFAQRMYALHPKKKNLVLVLPALAHEVSSGAQASDIEACHAEWCKTEDWRKENGKYAPPLDRWIADKGYTQHPKGHIKPDHPKHTAGEELEALRWLAEHDEDPAARDAARTRLESRTS